MKKFLLSIFILSLFPVYMTGQTFSELWKQADDAEQKDLPQTQQKVLERIVKKAEREKAYGQLLKAELTMAKVTSLVAPDSLAPAVNRLRQREQATAEHPLQAVLQAVLSIIYRDTPHLSDDASRLTELYQKKALTYPAELAAVKATDYVPFIETGADSKFFGNDLLSVIGFETQQMEALHQYYLTTQNRQAQLFTALELVKEEPIAASKATKLDSLISCYGDLQECGELAIEKARLMQSLDGTTAKETMAFIDEALKRWKGWKRIDELTNIRNGMTALQYHAWMSQSVSIPLQQQELVLHQLRGIKTLTLRVFSVKTDGSTTLNPNEPADYARLKRLLTPMDEFTMTRHYEGKESYELFNDTLILKGLPVGVYLIEMTSNPKTEVSRQLYFVSNLRVMAQQLPEKKMRYVTVNATTGQPVGGASLQLKFNPYSHDAKTVTATTDDKGEYIYAYQQNPPRQVLVWTNDDNACPAMNGYGHFYFHETASERKQGQVFTDRALYRPGQTVHVAAILYKVRNGYEHETCADMEVKAVLHDANFKMLEERTLRTDAFGTVTTDFTLPSHALTGQFHVSVDGHPHYFRVEEYKRPTFEVDLPKPAADYKAGDTLTVTGTARSYAGVPVQEARVSYQVKRQRAWWWLGFFRYHNYPSMTTEDVEKEVCRGETVTDAEGRFEVCMPMVMPLSDVPLFCQFIVTAQVTDVAGESHTVELSLPLGNRATSLSVDLPDKLLQEDLSKAVFHLRNAAGTELDDVVRYRIDEKKWLTVKTNEPVAFVSHRLKSGQHQLEAICAGDTLHQTFVVFSLDDKQPATETDCWFYSSAEQFDNNGKPVTIQVGSSDKDVHIVYTIVAGNQVLERGAIDRSNELINRKFTYREDYGNGLALSFAWIKNGKFYQRNTTIRRPLPDKRLTLKWETFRDRLTPGQQEEWTLSIVEPPLPGTTEQDRYAKAQLMATLYDKSLDQLSPHDWSFNPFTNVPLPSLRWSSGSWGMLDFSGFWHKGHITVPQLAYNSFDHDCFPVYLWFRGGRTRGGDIPVRMLSAAIQPQMVDAKATKEEVMMNQKIAGRQLMTADEAEATEDALIAAPEMLDEEPKTTETMPRENMQETAFFYPQLLADSTGRVHLKFTLPESLTTWRFLGVAHTSDLMVGTLEGETVAQKDVMIQPNMPRFLRMGDEAMISARIFNITEQTKDGIALLQLLDPESLKVLYEAQQSVSLKENGTQTVTYRIPAGKLDNQSLLICKMMVSGETFADGEQHYLPILPNREHVTVTLPFTQDEPGTKTVSLKEMVPADAEQAKLTFEYTNNPAWLMVQALPSVGHPHDNCIICQTASFYANSIGRHLLKQNPQAKHVFERWRQDTVAPTLLSSLQTNEELKDLILSETPWVADADRETEQKQRLCDFFDENLMDHRLASALEKMQKLQNADGSWSWWEDMPGSFYMTVEVCEMLARLSAMTSTPEENHINATSVQYKHEERLTYPLLLNKALGFLDMKIVERVTEMKKEEKKGIPQSFPSQMALEYLYINALNERRCAADVTDAQDYLKKLLKREKRNQTIYEKALSAIILKSPLYVRSLKEYTVYREEMGRYYDTPRAGYSWRDYRIPTQVAAIEAIQRLTPNDTVTLREMRRWLLQEKRTQAWDTPINSVNAIYAFLNNRQQLLAPQSKTVLKVDGEELDTPQATAGIGYVKTSRPAHQAQTFTAEKSSTGTSWGAVYAQFLQPTQTIADQGSGMKVKREILLTATPLKVGDRIKVRITVEADRDYDFVELIEQRAACMEPLHQLSGYRFMSTGGGYYCAPKDHATNYFFDVLPKGKHVLETEYYIDRAGQYELGTCSVSCAYAPEYRAVTHSQTITITEQNKE